jgi:Ca2+-binding EF-hand superfamily protein
MKYRVSKPLAETKDSDFSPYDLNKDGEVSRSEMQRANAKSKSKLRKEVFPNIGTGPYSGI